MAQVIVYENGNAIGGEGHPTDAGDITFDNTGTDLVSEEVESAIKEVNAKGTPKTDIAYVESGTTASRAYSIGEFVYVNDTLYKVINEIASGASFTVNTNIRAKSISDAMPKFRITNPTLTTTAQGFAFLGYSTSQFILVGVYAEGYACVPFKGASGWCCNVENYGSLTPSRIANTSITFECILLDKTLL